VTDEQAGWRPERQARGGVRPVDATVMLRRTVANLLDAATGAVAVVDAPGGYGKTSQVRAWSAQDGRPVAWVDMESVDDDPAVLFDVLMAALAPMTAHGQSDRGAPRSSGDRPLAALRRLMRHSSMPFVLVLDDVHSLSGTPSIELIAELIDHVPTGSTVVLIGRSRPAVPLARLEAHGGCVEIRAADLALSSSETESSLRAMGVDLDDGQIAEVVRLTEGWPLGVVLLGRALQGRAADEAVTLGSDRLVARYMREEWLRDLAPDDVDFLMRTSGLDRLSADICDHVLDRSDSGAVLGRLHDCSTMLVPLDRRGEGYRVHELLREALGDQLQRIDRRGRITIERRTSEWFEHRRDIERALAHALRVDDLGRAERIVIEHSPGHHTTGRYLEVEQWIEMFPRSAVMSSPGLCLVAGVAAFGQGHGDEVVTWVRLAKQALANQRRSERRPYVEHALAAFAAMAHTGAAAEAHEQAGAARRVLPQGLWHASACFAQGAWAFALGDEHAARELLVEGKAEAQLVGATSIEANCRAHLALLDATRGEWGRAAAGARSARRLVRDRGLEGMPTLMLVTAMSAFAAAMDGDVDQARIEIARARRQLAGYRRVCGWVNVQARVALAEACLRLGDRAGARAFVDELEPFLSMQPDAVMARTQMAALESRLARAQRVATAGPSLLTNAELRVLHLLPTNLTHEEIGQRLFVSRNTAKSHAAAVYRKLGAASRTEAVEAAKAAGLLPDDSPLALGP
jgi:LuxR family transcriptional regulator, maltose regulon positive regulatory protein